jgi:uncharacterized protein YjbI with pentapeptide repeats
MVQPERTMPVEPTTQSEHSRKASVKRFNYKGETFNEFADFTGAVFNEWAEFEGAVFNKGTNFVSAVFTRGANFGGTTFIKKAEFAGAAFGERIIFEDAAFRESASFGDASFNRFANFSKATFGGSVDFGKATFSGAAKFEKATFSGLADFVGVTFAEEANFVDSEMKSVTRFDNALFKRMPPLFDGAKLHEGTTWFGVAWPRSPTTKAEAQLTVRAYERLKLEMDKLKKHEDELRFFALELQARGVLSGKWSTIQGLAISIYGCLCDYGRSYGRPFWLLGALTILGAVPFLVHFGLPGLRGSLALSVANTFGVFGLRREFFLPTVIANLPWTLKLVSVIQTVAGAALFFLFGLGLRNRFRMR